ncbi:MAG: 50S ribosome-binding GTPase [Rickettsia sp.]|nr:50S ribosome-binding GTPase [Rickettsia sp.]
MFKAILIGKSNTGKSSLFNRFVQDKSIVMSESCSTRDIRYANARIGDINFLLGDSCGIDLENSQEFYNQVIKINKDSIESSDLILFMLDNRVLQDIDFQFLKFILKKKKNV